MKSVIAATALVVAAGCASTSPASIHATLHRIPHPRSRPAIVVGRASSVSQRKPVGSAAALRGHGEVAVVMHHHLYLLGGPARHLRRVHLPGLVSDPLWSHDGAWLAARVSKAPPKSRPYADEPEAVWLVTAAGHVVRRLTATGAHPTGTSWSPTSDKLEITTTSPHLSAHGARAAVVSVRGSSTTTLAAARDISGVAWSPDGHQLAVALNTFRHQKWHSRLALVPALGGTGRVITHEDGNVLDVADWWPDGSGVLAWLDYQGSGSLAADGLPLLDIDATTGHRRRLTRSMLEYNDWLSTSPHRDEVAFISGGDRELTESHKRLEVCSKTGCHAVPQPRHRVSFDPAWSGAGRLAVVRDQAINEGANIGIRFVNAVQNSGTVDTADGTSVHPISAAGSGATSPVWGRGGALLIVRHDALWLIAPGAQRATLVAGPLQLPSNYYGFVPWRDSFAWTDATVR